ncbi:MAG: PEP-CTERM sorting domain-containing protein [Bryobacteraceae bacterium]
MSRVVTLVVLIMLAAVAVPAISVDPGIIYNISTGTTQAYTTVGIPFLVNAPLTLTALGAYDYGANGLIGNTNITVEIRPFEPWPTGGGTISNNPVSDTTITLDSSSPQAYGSVWAYLGKPVTLNSGWYVLYATGFDDNNPVISGMGTNHTTLDTFNGAVSYGYKTTGPVTLYWIYTEDGWQVNNSAPIYISGGTLGVPEPSTCAFMATVGIALYLLRRRKAGLKSS